MDASVITSPKFVTDYITKGLDIEAKVRFFLILFVFHLQCFLFPH